MVVVRREGTLLTATERGMGKRSDLRDYRVQRRGGKGLINLKTTQKTGRVVAVKEVTDDDELMLVTRHGVINRQSAREIRVIGRNTQGVRLISLDEGDELVDVARVIDETVDPEIVADDAGVDGAAEVLAGAGTVASGDAGADAHADGAGGPADEAADADA